jgi:hypothetical protein
MIGSTEELVFAFDHKHEIGDMCPPYCSKQVRAEGYTLTDALGETLPLNSLYIVGEATREDWAKHVRAEGGSVYDDPYLDDLFFYFVRTD